MKVRALAVYVFVTLAVGVYAYMASNNNLDSLIVSQEWHSHSVVLFPERSERTLPGDDEPLDRIKINSKTKYLDNGQFINTTRIDVFKKQVEKNGRPSSTVEFSESGTWQINNNYLLISNTEVENVPTKKSLSLTDEQVNDLRNRVVMSSKQNWRIDMLNEQSLLLTSLSNDSQLLTSL